MIRLTVFYNLPPDTDEQEFVEWRLTAHQLAKGGMPGVVATTFHRIIDSADGKSPQYRFMTTADWTDRQSFEQGFYDARVQETLKHDLARVRDAVFLVSEQLSPSETSRNVTK